MTKSTLLLVAASIVGGLSLASIASAQTVILFPDNVTGDLAVKASTNTDDPRYTKTCVYRTDVLSPDPGLALACADLRINGTPTSATDGGLGVTGFINLTVTLSPGETQKFVAKNFAEELVDGLPVEVSSVESNNFGIMIGSIGQPVFVQ